MRLVFLSLLPNSLNKFNNTGAWMLDSIYHMISKILWNCIFGVNTSRFVIFYATLKCASLRYVTFKVCKSVVVYRFQCMVLYHLQTRRHVINNLFLFFQDLFCFGDK